MNKLQQIEQKRKEFEREIAEMLGLGIEDAQVDINIFGDTRNLRKLAANTPGYNKCDIGNWHSNYTATGTYVGGDTIVYK